VFEGSVRSEKVYIGESPVMDAKGVGDSDVYVAVRPEGFIVDENGPLACNFINREVMGRDTSVIATNEHFLGENIRAIIPSEEEVVPVDGCVRFSLKPHKVRLFDKIIEERIRTE
jgi:multiple sugar transport system ATP-binding protein